MLVGNLLHLRDERFALSPLTLDLLQFARQSYRLCVQLRVNHVADQIQHLLNPHGMLFKQLPNDRFGIDQTIRDEERFRVSLTQLLGSVSGVDLRFQNKNGGSHLSVIEKIPSKCQDNAWIG